MVALVAGWQLEVQRGPDWLFVRIIPADEVSSESPDVASPIWSLLEQHFCHRLVLEMDQVDFLDSHLIGQIVLLQKRCSQSGSVMRICGMNDPCVQAFKLCRLDANLINYADRSAAVEGSRPTQPR